MIFGGLGIIFNNPEVDFRGATPAGLSTDLDKGDKCPNEAGLATNNGCPLIDTDKDGIVDTMDACPSIAGLKATNGCPDRDGDNVADKDDSCPDLAGNTPNGCPSVISLLHLLIVVEQLSMVALVSIQI